MPEFNFQTKSKAVKWGMPLRYGEEARAKEKD
jgi:hypothetical protein